MNPTYPMRKHETLESIFRLIKEGAEKLVVIMRHSERHYHPDAAMEPFMGLTEDGKDAAHDLGQSLPASHSLHFFSSFFGRCIETSASIDKGYSRKHLRFNGHNSLVRELSPFYVTDIEEAVRRVTKEGSQDFIRSWFNGRISETIMADPEKTAGDIVAFLKAQLKSLPDKTMGINVSHDWNLFPVKEFFLGLDHETNGNVGYLESIILFEKNGYEYITNYQTPPVPLRS